MTPLARRIMQKVRERDLRTYERWIGFIVNESLEEAAKIADRATIPMCETAADAIAAAIRSHKDQDISK